MSAAQTAPFNDYDPYLNPAPKDPYASIPDEMKESRSWLVYKLEPGTNGRTNKIPYGVKSGRRENDPTKGASFEEAKAVVKDYSGLGFYVEPPYICLDLDDCVDKEGLVADYATEIVREMNTFAELSPSSTGIHIWAKGEKPGTACRRGIEIYGTRRFMTISANPIPEMPREVRTMDIKPVYDRMLRGDFIEPEKTPATTEAPTSKPATSATKESAKIGSSGTVITDKLQLLMTGTIVFNKPFVIEDEYGNSLRYESQSEADSALATLLARKHNGDAEKIDADFRASSLYRQKWERSDYRDRTIKSAISFLNKEEKPVAIADEKPASAQAEDDTNDLESEFCAVGELEDGGVKMIVDGFMPEGITMLGALPGECKTFFALSLSKALTTGKPFLGRFAIREMVPVLYLIPESSGAPFRKRCELFGIPNDRKKFLCRTISQGAPLAMDNPKIMEIVKRMKPLVVLDTAVRFNKSTDENSASANKFFVNDAIALIGAGARGVLGLHHATKSSRKEGLTPESALRGTGDLSAMADAVYGLQRNDKLFDNGNGPLELQVVCLKPRDFNPPLPFTIAAKAKVGDQLISHLDTKGDFVIVDAANLIQDLNNRFMQFVMGYPTCSYGEIAEELGIQRWKVQDIAKKLHYVKRGGHWTFLKVGVSDDPKASQDIEE